MTPELKDLYQRKKNAQAMLDFQKEAGAVLRQSVDATVDEIIRMDIEIQKTFDESRAADEAYAEAIKRVAREDAA
ncbi:hypothetical protein [Paludisphaera sp.]|uniref:hypothetical protein n=1 Tax=Paludisphaera sp. TaxID=2017432 RepID=UPI00301C973B